MSLVVRSLGGGLAFLLASLVALPAAAEAGAASSAGCRSNPPGLHTSEMLANGFAVLYRHDSKDREFIRLQYVFTDRLYYRYKGKTWRALYIGHPTAIYEAEGDAQDVLCAYVAGFPIRPESGGAADWVLFQDVEFVETP